MTLSDPEDFAEQRERIEYQRAAKISTDAIDALCKDIGFNPRTVYDLVTRLERSPNLDNVRLRVSKDDWHQLEIWAEYTGNENIIAMARNPRNNVSKFRKFIGRLQETTLVDMCPDETSFLGQSSRRREYGSISAILMSGYPPTHLGVTATHLYLDIGQSK